MLTKEAAERMRARAETAVAETFKLGGVGAGFFGTLGNAVNKGVGAFAVSRGTGHGLMNNIGHAIHGFQRGGGNKALMQAGMTGMAGYGAYRAMGGGGEGPALGPQR